MKLQLSDQSAEVQGALSSTNFTIEANAQAFLTLSEKLYSNKIGAVIRELSTNAYDSQIEFGNEETPFLVHLPTSENPFFSVRDFGTGLSDHDCKVLYSTYFKSTRNNTNSAVGCFGLGSKSPFAYADSFTVESFFNGEKRCYAAYKDEDGPHFDLMEVTQTKEPNGLLIKVPVQECDNYDFVREAKKVYRFFKVKPIFSGSGTDITFNDNEEVLISGDNWGVYIRESSNILIMGQIAYPLSAQAFTNYPHLQDFLNSVTGFRLEVNIGDAEITPSRENISYTKTTVSNLAAILESIPDQVGGSVTKMLSSEPTLFKARMAYLKVDSKLLKICGDVLYNGDKLFDDMRSRTINLPDGFSKFYQHRVRGQLTKEKNTGFYKFDENNIRNIVFSDNKLNHSVRIKRFIVDKYWYGSRPVLFCEDLRQILDLLGGATVDDITLLSTLPLPVKKNNDKYTANIPCHVYSEDDCRFVESKLSVKFENAYYLEICRGNVTIKNRHVTMDKVSTIISNLINAGAEFEGDFYLVKPSYIVNQSLGARSNWSSGEKLINEAYEKLVQDNFDDFTLANDTVEFDQANKARQFFSSGDIRDLLDEFDSHRKKVRQAEERIEFLSSISKYFNRIDTVKTFSREYFDDKYEELTQKYPFLNSFRYGCDKECAQYIKDIDELHKLREILSNIEQTV